MENIEELLEKKKERYGDAVENMQYLAESWTLWLKRRGLIADGKKLSAADVAVMNALFKINREGGKHTKDGENLTDAKGYLTIAEKYWNTREEK
jgi:hypothetical protein